MKHLSQHAISTLAGSFILVCAFAQAQETQHAKSGSLPESGLWITASGNLEVNIAPCGQALCGTVTRVIANQSMNNPAVAMAPPNAASPVGKKILYDLQPSGKGDWQGRIYNRENDKTYNSLISLITPDQLKLIIYEDSPASGKTQVWKRATAQ